MSGDKAFYDIDIDSCLEQQESAQNNDSPEQSEVQSIPLDQVRKPLSRETSLITLEKGHLAVNIENVAFSYKKNKPVLKDITLLIPEGETFCMNTNKFTLR